MTNDVLSVLRQIAVTACVGVYLCRGRYALAWMVDTARNWGRWR